MNITEIIITVYNPKISCELYFQNISYLYFKYLLSIYFNN